MADAKRDNNRIPTLLAVSSSDGITPVTLYADPTTHRLYVDLPAAFTSPLTTKGDIHVYSTTNTRLPVGANGLILSADSTQATGLKWSSAGAGSVTTISVATANGFAGTVADPTFNPIVTLTTSVSGILKGNATTISAATDGTDYLSSTTGVKVDQTVGQTIGATGARLTKLWATDITCTNAITGSVTGNAATVTNATLTTALTVNTGTVTLTGNAANTSVLTIGAGAVSVSGTNTGDNAANSSSTYIGTTAVALNRSSAALTLAGITLTTPDIGTPSAGVVTNLTGTASININGTVGATTPTTGKFTSVETTGAIELGAASDTTIARVSAGVASIEGNNIVVNTSSPTLATITTTGTIELGNASDTTVSRSSAGVIAVEGVVIPSISSTNTLTNKRITKRTDTAASSATPTINTDNVDFYSLTAQAVDITSFTTNLSGTPTEGQILWIAITGTAARAITWGASFEASTVALPTTTVSTSRLDVGFVWNTVTSKWRIVATS